MNRNPAEFPKGLSSAAFLRRYGSEGQCADALFKARWPDGFRCPQCGSSRHCRLRSGRLWQCNNCRHQTSLVAGTVFAATKLPLTVWFLAIHLLTQSKRGVSSLELARQLGVSQNTAWKVRRKLLEALKERDESVPLHGIVQADDAYRGGERSGGNPVPDGPSITEIVKAILREADAPLHYSELTVIASRRAGKQLSEKGVHNATRGVALLFGRGKYGIERHLGCSKEQIDRLCRQAEKLVCSSSGQRQWHTDEILVGLLKQNDIDFPKLDRYKLDIVLGRSKILTGLGRMAWALDKSDMIQDSRVNLHQAVIDLIREKGKPLSTKEVILGLSSIRGVGKNFQIRSSGPLIRVGRAMWGLRDRDVPESPAQQRAIANAVVAQLLQRQVGIHQSELRHLVPRWKGSTESLCSILASDDRIVYSIGNYLYLAEWGESRCQTIGNAVSELLNEATVPLTIEEISQSVAKRILRKCNRTMIAKSLRLHGAEYNKPTRTWSKSVDRPAIGTAMQAL